MPHLSSRWDLMPHHKVLHPLSPLFHENKRHPLLWSQKEKKGWGVQELDAPNSTGQPPLLLPILEWFYGSLIAGSWAPRRGCSTGYTVKIWRRKVLPNERKRKKKKHLLSCAQPWRERSSSSNFFFIFLKIKIRLDLIFNIKI